MKEAYSFLAIKEGEELVGLFGVWQLAGFRFIEHFAVSPQARGKGVGKIILEEVIHAWAQPILLEVEPPFSETNQRRIAFYERAGFCLNLLEYHQPPYSRDKPWVPLHLMSLPAVLSDTAFGQVREQLYRVVYHVVQY